jgi:hypothetical protein
MPELSLCWTYFNHSLWFSLSMSTQVSTDSGFSHLNRLSLLSGLRHNGKLHLNDVYFFSRLWLMLLLRYIVDFPLLSDYVLGLGTNTLSNGGF